MKIDERIAEWNSINIRIMGTSVQLVTTRDLEVKRLIRDVIEEIKPKPNGYTPIDTTGSWAQGYMGYKTAINRIETKQKELGI